MHDKIKVFIDPDSCAFFRIDPDEYKKKLLLAVHGMAYVEIIVDRGHSISDGIFPLGISVLTADSQNQQVKTLIEVQLAASTVFQTLAVNAQPCVP